MKKKTEEEEGAKCLQNYLKKRTPWAILAISFSFSNQEQVNSKTRIYTKMVITPEIMKHSKNVNPNY